MAHAKLSPSSAYSWLLCALSIKMTEMYGHLDPNRYSIANAQGTIKHAIIEDCLRRDVDPYSFVGMEMRLGDFREEDEDMPQEWADYIYEFTESDADTIMDALDEIDTYEGERFIEYRVNLSRWLPDQFGTLDLGIITDHGDGSCSVVIWDNKFGRIAVSPVENVQLMLYGLGFWDNEVRPRFERVRSFKLVIFQPSVRGGGGDWETSLIDLLDFAKFVKFRGKLALAENPKASPGAKQCEWCIGAKLLKCRAYVEWNRATLKAMLADDEDLDGLVDAGEMPCLRFKGVDPKFRTWLLENGPMFVRFMERLEESAYQDAYLGNPVPGKKLVLGHRPRRKYRNVARAEERLTEEMGPRAYTKKLISPAQLEKIVGKKRMDEYADLVEVGEPKMVLVDENDTRPRVPSIREMLMEDEGE